VLAVNISPLVALMAMAKENSWAVGMLPVVEITVELGGTRSTLIISPVTVLAKT
jgi:hypothetical protein